MKRILCAALLLTFTTIVKADTLKGGYWGCVSEDLFDQVMKAQHSNPVDKAGLNYLSQNGCFITKSGIQVSVLDRSWGKAKVRAYAGDSAVILWTNTENIQR